MLDHIGSQSFRLGFPCGAVLGHDVQTVQRELLFANAVLTEAVPAAGSDDAVFNGQLHMVIKTLGVKFAVIGILAVL